jgi:tight adherence protein B
MNRDQLVLSLAAVVLVVGIAVVWSGLHVQPLPARPSERPVRRPPLVAALVAASAVVAISGWIIPSVVIGAIVGWIVDSIRRGRAGDDAGVERSEALASWVENVRDVLQSGNQPVGAIGATTETCPPSIRPHVRSLFARLSAGQPAEVAFRRFADDMDEPLADLVAVGLLIAVSRGAETEDVLSALAAQARHQADRRRIVEAERAPMRREVWMVSLVMCALLGGLFLFARSSYLNAYDDASGQLFLAFILVAYGAMLVWVGRLATFPRPARFLTLRQAES